MLTRHEIDGIAPPFSAYCHAVEAKAASRWLHVSGQVGVNPDGSFDTDSRRQMERCWQNVLAVLAGADMTKENLVKVTAFVTDAADVAVYRETRDQYLAGTLCASTLLVISALAHPEWKIEIEVVAAE